MKRAAGRADASSTVPQVPWLTRPVWLWPEPQPLHERAAGPLLDGRPLQLLAGPERIESGWWDDELAARDYFIAAAPRPSHHAMPQATPIRPPIVFT